MSTPLEKYFHQRTHNLFNQLHNFELNSDDISLHDLRVEMKKLKAIIKFLRSVYSKQKFKKPVHLLRAVFREAGEIRELQLIHQWLQRNSFAAIKKMYYPDENLQEMITEFLANAHAYKNDFKEIIETITPYVENTNIILAEQYYADLNAQLETQCRKDLPISEWHELRKLIKLRIYAYNWIEHENENDDPLFSYLNKLQENIGLWHDLEIIKDSFSQHQIYLSQDLEVQKDFSAAWEKLNASLRYRERHIKDMLIKQEAEM